MAIVLNTLPSLRKNKQISSVEDLLVVLDLASELLGLSAKEEGRGGVSGLVRIGGEKGGREKGEREGEGGGAESGTRTAWMLYLGLKKRDWFPALQEKREREGTGR